MNGSIRQRSAGSWELRAYVGVDPATGRRLDRSITVRGNRSDAERELAEMVARIRCVRRRVALDDERAVRGMVRDRGGWVVTVDGAPEPGGPSSRRQRRNADT